MMMSGAGQPGKVQPATRFGAGALAIWSWPLAWSQIDSSIALYRSRLYYYGTSARVFTKAPGSREYPKHHVICLCRATAHLLLRFSLSSTQLFRLYGRIVRVGFHHSG